MNTIRPSELVDVFIQRTGFVFYRTLLFVCLFVCGTKMSTLSEVGKHAMGTYHVLARNEKIASSTYLTSESVLGYKALSTYLKVAFNFHDLSL